jgi:SNF2 family DNA or RNA helicase
MSSTFGKLWLDLDGTGGHPTWRIDARPHVLVRLKRIFDRAVKRGDEVWLKNTDEICRDLLWFIQRYPLEVSDGDLQRIEGGAEAFDRRAETFQAILNGTLTLRKFDLALPMREYQKIAAELALRTHGLLIADDVGIGKTLMGIGMLIQPETRPALIVTLTHLPLQWQRELVKFAPKLRTHIIKSRTPYPLDRLPGKHDFLRPKRQMPDVFITNYHKLTGWVDVFAGMIKTVIFDEGHELRRSASEKYQAAKQIADKAQWRAALTATPIFNYGGEFFNVIDVLRPDALGTREEFLREWCKGYAQREDKASISDPRAFGSYLREQGLMLRRTRRDVGRELPEVVKIPHYIECDSKVLDAAQDAASELARIILAKDTAWEERGKASREFDQRMRQSTGIAKAPFIAEFIRMLVENGERPVLFCWHRAVYDLLMERLKGLHPVLYTGSESPAQKEESRKAFIEGRAQVLIMSLRSGAGLDGLQDHAHTVVFGELDWSPSVLEQCVGRLHRDGQGEAVVVYYLLAEEGSDPVISDVLGLKRQQLEPVRNPDAELVEKLQTDDDHIKRLAESYLKRHQRKLPPTEELPENVIPLVPTGGGAYGSPPEADPEEVVEPPPEADPEPELEGKT